MASNIRVVLQVDNKKYLNDIKAAENATKNFADTTERNINKLDRSIDGVSKQFGRLKTVLAGAAFAAIGRSIFALADEIDDLSNSTGIAAGRLIEFRNALEQSGGSPTDAAAGIIKFTQALDTAAEGSVTAQNGLIDLGISLQQLRTQTDEQLMMGVLEELAKMEAGARRTALMVEYFGKSFRTVDPSQLLANLKATRGEGDAYAASVAKAAELNGKLEKAFANLRLALLAGFGPVIEQISAFADVLSRSQEEIDKLVTVVKVAATVFAGLFAVGGALIFIRYIGVIGRGLGAAFTLLQKWGPTIASASGQAGRLGAAISGAFRVSGPLLTALRGIVVAVGTLATGVFAASQVFDNFGDIASNAIARVIEALGNLAGEILNLPTDALAAFLNLLPGVEIKNAVGLGTPFKIAAENARKAREEVESLQKSIRARQNFAQQDPRRLDRPGGSQVPEVLAQQQAAGDVRDVDTTARTNAIKQIQEIGAGLTENLRKRREQLGIERQAIGISEDAAEALKLQADVNDEITKAIDTLIQKRETLGKEEKYLTGTINEQIAALEARRETEVAGVLAALQAKQAAAAQDRIQLAAARQINELEALRAQLLGYSLTELEKFNAAQRAGDFRSRTQQEINQLREQAIERDKLASTLAAEKTGRETNAKLMELESSIMGRQFTELEKLEQLKSQNPEAFARKTQAEIIALQQQAAALDEVTAKFNAMAFARDLQRQGEDFTAGLRDQLNIDRAISESARRRIQVEIDGRNQLASKLREIQDRYGDEMKLSDELRAKRRQELDEATNAINNLTALKKKSVEEDQAIRDSFTFGWDTAFSKYAEDANNAANQAKTYFETFTRGFEDAFVRFVQTGKISFKDLANSIIADFARIQAKKALTGLFGASGGGGGFFGNIFGSIGKIFGFANGGNPGIGKPILVGERGPELMIPRNASTIIPNEALGGGQMTTNVTYSIQAVDAASFQQLIARDPKFLHAVVEKGKRSLPQGARQ